MKLPSAAQIRAWDEFTLVRQAISSLELMERAASAFVKWFVAHFDASRPLYICCGMGNNGGDGLAIARLLTAQGYHPQVYVLRHREQSSPDFEANLHKLAHYHWISTALPDFERDALVIDALLGSGLSRPVEGLLATAIAHINAQEAQGATIIAVDIASGLYVDEVAEDAPIIRPHYTFSFEVPKLCFLLPENESYTGAWHAGAIGLEAGFAETFQTPYFLTDLPAARALFKPRGVFAHKGTFGHVLLLAGSYGKIGAALLSGAGCLRAGAGLLTLASPRCGYTIVQTALPEAMSLPDPVDGHLSQLPPLEAYAAIGIGPGIGTHPQTAALLDALLNTSRKPLVLDADALNILSTHPSWLERLPPGTLLTPHPKEFERLAGRGFTDSMERLTFLRQFAQRYQVVVLLKGHYTAVALPEGSIHFNSTGNPGMATGGSGDVLTGIVSALLAQGYLPTEAAILGAYVHGLAGDLAAREKGMTGLIASDLIAFLPKAFQLFETAASARPVME